MIIVIDSRNDKESEVVKLNPTSKDVPSRSVLFDYKVKRLRLVEKHLGPWGSDVANEVLTECASIAG